MEINVDKDFGNNLDGSSAHRETVASYFSTKSNFWTVVYTQENGACNDYMGFHMRRRRDVVLNFLNECLAREGAVLDVGCGAGALVVSMTELGHRVHGVDISPGMVEKAREYSGEHGVKPENIQTAAVESLPFDDSAFDVVTCVGVLEYVSDAKAALAELKRVIKEDGRIILTMPNLFKLQNIFDPYYWVVRATKYCTLNSSSKRTGARSQGEPSQISSNANCTNKRYSYRQLVALLADSSLVPVEVVGLGYGPFTLCRKKLFSEDMSKKISDTLERMFRKVLPGDGKYVANRWVVCLKKMK